MMEVIFTALSIFPISFFFYSWTEKAIARHESRVGRQITFFGFLWQTWVDSVLEIRTRKPMGFWGLIFFQCSLPFLYSIEVEYLAFPWIAMNGVILIHLSPTGKNAVERVEWDQRQVSFAVACGVSILCLVGAFTFSGTANLSHFSSGPLHWFFLLPFVSAGAILYEERPFRGFRGHSSWIDSVRFYCWCLFAVRVFMGGGEYLVDTNLKAGALFWVFRVFGIYFPRYRQQDLLRIAVIYLFPITGVLWLSAMLIFALGGGGGFD